jgi:hypothetical protein
MSIDSKSGAAKSESVDQKIHSRYNSIERVEVLLCQSVRIANRRKWSRVEKSEGNSGINARNVDITL